MLTHKELEQSCEANGLYFCDTNYDDNRVEVIEENPELSADEIKLSTMSRMLSEHLDYCIASETDEENENGELHSDMMGFRTDVCDAIARKWCDGVYKLGNIPVNKWLNEARKDCERLVMEHYFGKLADVVIDQLWGFDECKTIEDKALASAFGHAKIIEVYRHTAAKTADEFWNEVNTYFSGSVLDGSPFDAAEAEKYSRFTWERYSDD